MLVLSRKPNESIIIDGVIRVTVVSVKGDRVRLGIEAPDSVPVDRAEVHARRMQFVEVPIGVSHDNVDLGAMALATAETWH
jgi:carbon storage regulator